MSSGSVRRVSRQDIQLVQNLIEQCLQLYMNQKEVMETLSAQAKIEPDFTELVWQKLEEENREFFKAYYLRLMVKHQILEFNKLLERQVQLMHQIHPGGVGSITNSNGSHMQTLNQNSACYAPEPARPTLKPENIQHALGSTLPSTFANGGSSLHANMPTNNMVAHSSQIDAPLAILSTHKPNMGLMHGTNGGMSRSETVYSGSSPYLFGPDRNVLETRQTIRDASGASFSSAESNSVSLNDQLLDVDTSPFEFLGHIHRDFSLTDLTADFTHSSDILESYQRSPFLPTDTENFIDHQEREQLQGDNRRLDSISEGLSYEDFGSE